MRARRPRTENPRTTMPAHLMKVVRSCANIISPALNIAINSFLLRSTSMYLPQFRPFLSAVAFALLVSSAMAQQPSGPTDIHQFNKQQLSDTYYSEGVAVGDIDGDGQNDVVYGPYWFAGPDFKTKHEIFTPVAQPMEKYADHFFAWIYDFNGDKANDVFVVGFPGTPAHVYENPGKGKGAWKKHQVFDWVSNESPQLTNLVGDDRPELICTRDGMFGFASVDWTKPFSACCCHTEKTMAETALVWLADDDRGSVSTEATIAMRGREFLPHTAVIRSGGAVRFPNQDPFSHNVFSNSDPVAFDLGLYRRGVTRSATFARPGVYPIYCNIHAKMVSYVVAVPGRHVTFAGADGRFELSDVPVGTYRLHVWHERAARVSAVVTVTPTGATQSVTLDARGWISGAHLNKFGAPYTSTRADRY